MAATSAAGGAAAASPAGELERNILPEDPSPSHYDLHIMPKMSPDFTFAARVRIACNAKAACTSITVNSAELTYNSGSVSGGGLAAPFEFAGADVQFDERNGRATVNLPAGSSVVGDFVLAFDYNGSVNDRMAGFYRSEYTRRDGTKDFMGVTQFEAVDARKALPCWDEPERKATFKVTLRVAKDLKAVSNSEIEREEAVDGGDERDVVFATTPKMSTYLLAWVFADFDFIEGEVKHLRSDDMVKMRVYTVPGKSEQGRFALEVALKTIPLYEEMFGCDYPLNKYDQLAIPDFSAGAMENYGCVTFRETALLCDETSAARTREWVALVVTHEAAHQWFGNRTTMAWWSGLWLNESFATWVEYWAVATLFPEWDVWTQFIFDETGRALKLDALESSHPVQVHVVNAEEIDEIFDVISYSKGGSVLRQAIEHIGMDAFKVGIRAYIAEFAWANATTPDLWRCLGEAAGRDLVAEMDSWVFKQGYPLLSVTEEGNGGGIAIEQRRFMSSPSAQQLAQADETLWRIPLTLVWSTAEGALVEQTLTERRTSIAAPAASGGAAPQWVKVNGNQKCFVRVHYAPALLEKLKEPIRRRQMAATDRFAVLSDLHAFAETGLASAAEALAFAGNYVDETDGTVWCAVAALDGDCRALVAGDAALKEQYNAYMRSIYTNVVRSVGFAPNPQADSHRTSQLRSLIFGAATRCKHPEAVAAALRLWNAYAANPGADTAIPADLRPAVYTTALRELGRPAFDALKRFHGEAQGKDASEAARIIRILGLAASQELVAEAVEYVLSDAVKSQDAFFTLVTVSGNEFGQEIYASLLLDRFDELSAKFPGMIFSRILKAVENMTDTAFADRLMAFIETLPEQQKGQIFRSAQQGVEGLRVAAAWRARDQGGVAAFLARASAVTQ